MNGDEEHSGATRVAAFSEQVSEILDLSEMAATIKNLAVQVEVQLLGHSGPHGKNEKEQVFDTSSQLSLVSSMRNYTRLTRESLQTISGSLRRISDELGGVGLNEPQQNESFDAPTLDRRLDESFRSRFYLPTTILR